MNKILIATNNKFKVAEFTEMFSKYNYEVFSLLDYPDIPDIIEDGNSFKENALIKAKAVSNLLNITCIADDSGLEVFSLNGEPGIYSARYAGPKKDDFLNNEMLLKKIKNKKDRSARYVSAIAIVKTNGESRVYEAYFDGDIVDYYKGLNGFGYDPIFYLKDYDCTYAELDIEIRSTISHRYKAFKMLIEDGWYNENSNI